MMQTGTTQTVWQISAGPASRSYADIFLKFGVGLIGPGDAGPWNQDRDDDEFEGGFVRRFASEVKIRDIFLLRTGMSKIRALGVAASEYLYLNAFDDVNGWDLQHARRIRWFELPEEYDFEGRVFGANPPRLSKIGIPTVVDYARRFVQSPPTRWQETPLPPLPKEEPPLEKIPTVLQGLVAQVSDLAELYWNREAFGEHPTEDELITHYAVPLLRCLGWPPERIAVKWRYIDITVFTSLPRIPEHCYFVIEAKRLGAGVEGALGQAQEYVKDLGVPRDIVVTDGIRYRFYSAKRDFDSVAYANLARLKQSATELFKRMKSP